MLVRLQSQGAANYFANNFLSGSIFLFQYVPLQLVQFEDKNDSKDDYYLLEKGDNKFLFDLFPYKRIVKNFVLHLILLEGDLSAIEKAVNVSRNEFDTIEEASAFFNEVHFRPLTYTSIGK